MPLYEYQCNDCGETCEELVPSINGPHPRKCPSCGKPRLARVPFGDRPAVLHMRYSPMAPRHMRGQRGRPRPRRKPGG